MLLFRYEMQSWQASMSIESVGKHYRYVGCLSEQAQTMSNNVWHESQPSEAKSASHCKYCTNECVYSPEIVKRISWCGHLFMVAPSLPVLLTFLFISFHIIKETLTLH